MERSEARFQRLASFVDWHQARVGQGGEMLRERLRKNPNFPQERWSAASDPDASRNGMGELALGLDQAVDQLLTRVESPQSSPQERLLLYSTLFELSPGDQARLRIRRHLLICFPTDGATAAWQRAIAVRWADSSAEKKLLTIATTASYDPSTSPAPDLSSEAIRALGRLGSTHLSHVARFWLTQVRWRKSVVDAWRAGGALAEQALCQSLLEIDVARPPSGAQNALAALSESGGSMTLGTTRILAEVMKQREATNSLLFRLVEHARLRTEARLEMEKTR